MAWRRAGGNREEIEQAIKDAKASMAR